MFGKQELTALQMRKRALLLESELNRLTVRAECARLRGAASWVGRAAEIRRAAGPWLLVLAPLAGLAVAFGLRRSAGWLGSLGRAVEVIGPIMRLWHRGAGSSAGPRD